MLIPIQHPFILIQLQNIAHLPPLHYFYTISNIQQKDQQKPISVSENQHPPSFKKPASSTQRIKEIESAADKRHFLIKERSTIFTTTLVTF